MIERAPRPAQEFFRLIGECLKSTQASTQDAPLRLDAAIDRMRKLFRSCHARGGKLIFIGNGGSAAIASHMAVDWSKNGGVRSIAFNDAPTLTCLANDFGYDRVFAKQIEYYATKHDVPVIISSSGRSLNIIAAADSARVLGCTLVTLTGMNPNNLLRSKGDVNLYVPSTDYGLVEISHLALLHSIV